MNGALREWEKIEPCLLKGTLTMPGSKSYAQRFLALAFLQHQQPLIISNVDASQDTLSVIGILKQLQYSYLVGDNHSITIQEPLQRNNSASLQFGESGLAFRLLLPILVCLYDHLDINVPKALVNRQQDFLWHCLSDMGVIVDLSQWDNGKLILNGKAKHLPSKVNGQFSSQHLSGILYAACLLNAFHQPVQCGKLVSQPYFLMTLAVLQKAGWLFAWDAEKLEWTLIGKQGGQQQWHVEGDWSSASQWLAASTWPGNQIIIKGLDATSLQADKVILKVLESVYFPNQFPKNEELMKSSNFTQAINWDISDTPDLVFALVLIAVFANGRSQIQGINRLINKESNRIEAIRHTLQLLEVPFEIVGNTLCIEGGKPLKGGVDLLSYDDHRMVMFNLLLASRCEKPCRVNNLNALQKSYPDFYLHFRKLCTHE